MTAEQDIKEAIKAGKLVIGTRTVMKGLKRGTIQSVVCASNCPAGTKKDLEHYTKVSKINVKEFKGNSKKLGTLCAKRFNTVIVGVKK